MLCIEQINSVESGAEKGNNNPFTTAAHRHTQNTHRDRNTHRLTETHTQAETQTQTETNSSSCELCHWQHNIAPFYHSSKLETYAVAESEKLRSATTVELQSSYELYSYPWRLPRLFLHTPLWCFGLFLSSPLLMKKLNKSKCRVYSVGLALDGSMVVLPLHPWPPLQPSPPPRSPRAHGLSILLQLKPGFRSWQEKTPSWWQGEGTPNWTHCTTIGVDGMNGIEMYRYEFALRQGFCPRDHHSY